MKKTNMNAEFWQALDQLAEQAEIVIDRPKDSAHPKYPQLIYPLDYGYLSHTASADGEGIDIWLGTDTAHRIEAVVCTVDLINRDSEIKILIGCTPEEKQTVLAWHNGSEYMKAILINREEKSK